MSRSSQLVVAVMRAIVDATSLTVFGCIGALAFQRVPPVLALFVDTAGVVVFWAMVGPLLDLRLRGVAAALTAAVGAGVAVNAVGRLDDQAWPVALLAGALFATLAVWRALAVAATASSWRAAASSGGVALAAVALAALLPLTKSEVGAMAIVAGVAGTVALSVARGAEETFTSTIGADARRGPGSLAAVVVGIGALVLTTLFPQIGALLGVIADRIAPYARELVILFVTPFVYLADALIRALLPFLKRVNVPLPALPLPPTDPAAEAEYARQMSIEATVFLQRFFFALAALVVALLLARVILARIAVARGTAALEREGIAGESIRAMLGGLLPARAATRRAPPAGGDALARVRRAYWDLLAVAERGGVGWRAAWQTPREHARDLAGWDGADEVVATFEQARYAGRASDADAERAERAVRALEASLAARG